MSANPNSNYMTVAEYLEFERESDIRHEYINGEVNAMAGASPNHNRITMKLSYRLYGNLTGKTCEVFGGDQRVQMERYKTYFYPDLSVVGGEPQFTDDKPEALQNPILIIEVLSPTTEKFDRDEKFSLYRQLDSLREYALVSQESPRIACYYLNENNIWEFSDAVGLESSITFKSLDCTLSLADIYEHVVFED